MNDNKIEKKNNSLGTFWLKSSLVLFPKNKNNNSSLGTFWLTPSFLETKKQKQKQKNNT